MDEVKKKALIKKLGADSNAAFDSRYSGDNRKWFVGKIIDSLLAQGVPDANIEQQTNKIILDAGAVLKARIKKGFSSSSLADKWALLDQMKSRTQIIYGLIAMHREFRDAANANYFDFILERRFRAIRRMAFSVNPTDIRNIFAYPKGAKMKVNKDATGPPPASPFWFGVQAGNVLPFVLTGRGKSNPEAAVEILFNVNTGSDRNLFLCDPVATILHMDALRAATDPNKLLNALISVGDHYLKIDHPDGHFGNFKDGQAIVGVTSAQANAGKHVDIELGNIGQVLMLIRKQLTAAILTDDDYISFQGPPFTIVREDVHETFQVEKVNPVTRVIRVGTLQKSYQPGAKVYVTAANLSLLSTLPFHFISDSRPEHALFEQVTIKSADLQVGDHVYVINHPLYQLFYPSGEWGGEHSFISEIGSRDSTSSVFRNNVKVGGHGLPNTTLLGMIDQMLEHNNIVLAILQSLTQIHLGNLKKNGRPAATVTVNTPDFKFKFIKRNEGGFVVNVFEYTMDYKYSLISKGKPTTFKMNTGFVIKERANDPDKAFQVWKHDGTDSISAAPIDLTVVFTGAGPAEQFMLSKWALAPFFNSQTVHFDTQPLFKKDNKTPNQLTFDDIVKSKPFFVTDDKDAFVTRPRVNFDPTYQTFLKNNGAI
jgi:hypothetical protein